MRKPTLPSPLRRAARWLSDWHELLGIPLGLALFGLSDRALRWVDPSAATYDWGIFQASLWAAAVLLFAKGVAWLTLRLDFPDVYRFLDTQLGHWLRNAQGGALWVSLAYYALHLLALLGLTVALL